ncbi:MAG TPA: hypothetical protein VI953_01685 [Candidatus Paceibacterota bacterium]
MKTSGRFSLVAFAAALVLAGCGGQSITGPSTIEKSVISAEGTTATPSPADSPDWFVVHIAASGPYWSVGTPANASLFCEDPNEPLTKRGSSLDFLMPGDGIVKLPPPGTTACGTCKLQILSFSSQIPKGGTATEGVEKLTKEVSIPCPAGQTPVTAGK